MVWGSEERARASQMKSHSYVRFLSQFDFCFEVVGSHTLNFRSKSPLRSRPSEETGAERREREARGKWRERERVQHGR